MENNKFKRGVLKPRFFKNAEEIKNYKSYYMLNKDYYCNICDNGKNYRMAGKTQHEQTIKDKINLQRKNNELV